LERLVVRCEGEVGSWGYERDLEKRNVPAREEKEDFQKSGGELLYTYVK
jgi:hypothetical protein